MAEDPRMQQLHTPVHDERTVDRQQEHGLTSLSPQSDKLQSLITAAKVPDVEPIWCTLFAKALDGKNLKDMLLNVGGGGAPAAAAAGGAPAGGDAAAADAPAAEEKKEEAKEESDDGEFRQYQHGCTREEKQGADIMPTQTWDSVSSTKRTLRNSGCCTFS